jgi:23S rRNA G2069 N7-methylase RlmK/C1962 C5-methylase RlmI
MGEAAAHALGLERNNIIIKQRERQRGQAQYERIANHALIRTVCEGKLKFKVNLSDYLDTGLFLDRRAMRRMVNADSMGKRVLNLFCYTGSFSVHAAECAASTCSIDLSNTYLAWAKDNFALNGFDAVLLRPQEYFSGTRSSPHQLVRADAAAFLQQAMAARLRWDTIILDPPAFSNSTMAQADFDLNRDYEELLANCLSLLAGGGKLWFSAAARSFKTNAPELGKRYPGVTVTDIGDLIVDEDFKGRKMPKAFVLAIP